MPNLHISPSASLPAINESNPRSSPQRRHFSHEKNLQIRMQYHTFKIELKSPFPRDGRASIARERNSVADPQHLNENNRSRVNQTRWRPVGVHRPVGRRCNLRQSPNWAGHIKAQLIDKKKKAIFVKTRALP